jgi:hypothetical protein
MNPNLFVFNHFPKTGGTTALQVMRQNLSSDDFSPHLAEHDVRIKPSRFSHYPMIAGHFSIVSHSAWGAGRLNITWLREPIRRILSTYIFWRQSPNVTPVTAKAKELSFADFVTYFQSSPALINNAYTHHFAGLSYEWSDSPDDRSSLLEHAWHNLCCFDFVGRTEEMAASIRALCQHMDWCPPQMIPHLNRSYSESLLDQIDSKTMNILLRNNELDRELYRRNSGRFDCFYNLGTGRNHIGEGTATSGFVVMPPVRQTYDIGAILRVTVRPPAHQRTFSVCIDYRTRCELPGLIAGIAVRDASGQIIWDGNTALEGKEIESGRNYYGTVLFNPSCPLYPGTYILSTALSDLRHLGFHYDWQDHTVFVDEDNVEVSAPLLSGAAR